MSLTFFIVGPCEKEEITIAPFSFKIATGRRLFLLQESLFLDCLTFLFK